MMFFNRNTGQKSLPNYATESGGASGWRGRRQSRTDETRDFNIYDGCEDEPAENVNRRKRSETFWKIWKIVRVPVIIAASLFITYMLLSTVGKAIHTQLTVEAFSIQPMLPLYLTVVSGSCNANPMITNAALFEEQLKAGFLRRIVCQKRFCPFCSVVCLHLSYRKRAAVN